MPNLLDSIRASGSALDIYGRALDVIQNNVTNSATPGYAKQALRLEALPLDVAEGLAGGVAARGLEDARNEFAEDEVRRQLQTLGFFEGLAQGATSVEGLFDVTGTGGVPAALRQLYQRFSAWSVSPSSAEARQGVVAAAGVLADDVRALSGALANTAASIHAQTGSTVDEINQLAASVQRYNIARTEQGKSDPGRDANVHAALEQLSELVDTTTLIQRDGTITVLLSGGAPLVVGGEQYSLRAASNEAGSAVILDWQRNDATSQVTGGRLGGLLKAGSGIVADTRSALNRFTESFAAAVNGIAASGSVAPDNSTPGLPLFTYDAGSGASSFRLNPSLTPADLAAVDADGNANGVPLKLASLANSADAGGVEGATFADFFGRIEAGAGSSSAAAQERQQSQTQIVAQMRVLRDRISGVSLDEQAILLMQFQRSYQAAARLVTTLNDMAGELMNLIR